MLASLQAERNRFQSYLDEMNKWWWWSKSERQEAARYSALLMGADGKIKEISDLRLAYLEESIRK